MLLTLFNLGYLTFRKPEVRNYAYLIISEMKVHLK